MRDQASDIEEILVTGEKQNSLQDAPTSSTSFSAGELQALRIEDISDLADYTPNLEINTAFAASNPTIFIRGIGLKDYNANAAGAVAVYQDGININAPAIQLGQLFDIDGIDVLRGPQGSVNGRNATAGAILIRSAMPDGEFGVSTSLTYGNYDNKEVEAAINIPLVEDMLSMRVSGTAQWRDGYTKNQCAGWDGYTKNQCAGWQPENHVNPRTGEPLRRMDEFTTRDAYEELDAAGQWTFNPTSGEYEIGTVLLHQQNNPNRTREAFVYLDYDYALEDDDLSGDFTGNPNNPWVLGETLRDSDGNPIIPYDPNNLTPVAIQKPTLEFAKNAVDGICLLQEPGKIVTTAGQFENRARGWTEGDWRKTRIQPGIPEFAGLKSWTNNIDNWAARMVLLFEPLDNMEWMANLHGTQNRGDSAHLQMIGAASKVNNVDGVDEPAQFRGDGQGGGNPYSGFYSSDGIEYIDAWGINGRGFWDLGAVVITLLYDYEWYDREVQDEGDANPSVIFPAIWLDSAWQTTEELRIEGEGERYKWTTGFFFLHEKLDASNIFPATQNFHITQAFQQKLTSWAPYVSGEIDLVEEGMIPGIYELTLGAGVRYNHETKNFVLGSSAIPSQSDLEIQILKEPPREATWKEWTGDVQLSYTPFSNEYGTLLSYLKYGHGFKGGHFNAGLTVSGGNDIENQIGGVEPEFIDAVEFGVRTRWFDDRVILNAAVFRYWYQDLQVFDISNEVGALPIQKLLNGDADVLGAEAELRVKPFPGALISANMGWLDTEFKDFVVRKSVTTSRGRTVTAEFDYSGNTLVAAPEWNFSVITEYETPSIFGWGTLVPQYDFNYRSKGYLDPSMTDPISQDGYWIHNARIAYRSPDERIEVAFWVSNLFDEEYKIDVFDLSRDYNTILEVWGEPRTYGVTLSLNW